MKNIFQLVVMFCLVLLLQSCGGNGGSGLIDSAAKTVTVNATVPGTTLVAVDTSSNAVVARKSSVIQTDGSKIITMTLTGFKQYKFYLVENEGTDYERVFPIYIGGSNKFNLGIGNCDLGYISTSDGTAAPTNSPAQFTGAGEDTNVPSGVASSQSSIFTQADLAGTWYLFQLNSGPTPYYSYAVAQIDANGNYVSVTNYNSSGQTSTSKSGRLYVTTGGIVYGNYSRLVMSRDKTLMVGGAYYAGYTDAPSLTILVKAGSGFSQSDLSGNWRLQGLTASSTKRNWFRSDAVIDAYGVMTMSNYLSSNGNTTPGTNNIPITIDSTGLIGVGGGRGAMTQDKNLMVMVVSNTDGSVSLALFVRTGGTNFSLADLQGEWRANWLTLGPSGQSGQDSWGRGLGVIDSNYVRTFDKVINGVIKPNKISPLTISVLGTGMMLGFAGNGEGILSLDKKLAVITQSGDTNSGYSDLEVLLK